MTPATLATPRGLEKEGWFPLVSDRTSSVNPADDSAPSYVKLHRSIWNDPDWRLLSTEAQRLYLLLMSQPDISHVGIVPYLPSRWARLGNGSTVAGLLEQLDELSTAEFVVVDTETEEVLIRTYAIHDRAWKLTNGKKSLVAAHGKVYSPRLRNAIRTVLATVDVTVDPTVEPTVTATVDVTVSAHKTKTQDMKHETPPPTNSNGGGGVHPKQVAREAAELLLNHETNVTRTGAWLATVTERLLNAYDCTALTAQHIHDLEHPTTTSSRDPEAELHSARRFGASVKDMHWMDVPADLRDEYRTSFINELPYEGREATDPEAWAAAALEAYDTHTPALAALREVPQ